eukprot:gene15075-biopygen12216
MFLPPPHPEPNVGSPIGFVALPRQEDEWRRYVHPHARTHRHLSKKLRTPISVLGRRSGRTSMRAEIDARARSDDSSELEDYLDNIAGAEDDNEEAGRPRGWR